MPMAFRCRRPSAAAAIPINQSSSAGYHLSLSESIYFDVNSQSLCDNINIIIVRCLFTQTQILRRKKLTAWTLNLTRRPQSSPSFVSLFASQFTLMSELTEVHHYVNINIIIMRHTCSH